MKQSAIIILVCTIGIFSCKKEVFEPLPVGDREDTIVYHHLNKQLVSVGSIEFDFDQQHEPDFIFEIINLNESNPGGLPNGFDTLAIRVIPINGEVLDLSTYHYPAALEVDYPVISSQYWSNERGVLATFGEAGSFKGKKDKFLAVRLIKNDKFQYGWIKLSCSQHNDTLQLIDFAYNKTFDKLIKTGDKE